MTKNDDFQVGGNPNMLYDLRQTYAMEILRPLLIAIEYHRDKNEFVPWFDKLTMGLHTNVNQKLSEEEREEYNKLLNDTIKELNEHNDTFMGRNKDAKEIYTVKMIIKNLEMWLKIKMEESGIYGKGFVYDPDEI